MFGFGKKKDKPVMPALFEGQITCDGQGYNSWKKPGAQRQTLLNLTKLGSAVTFEGMMFNGKPLYAVLNKKGYDICCLPAPLSEYISQMVDCLTISGNLIYYEPPMITMRVYGKYRNEYNFYDGKTGERGKEYSYHLDNPKGKYYMLPVDEIMCDLVETDDGYDVKVGEDLIGTINDERKDKLKNMLRKYHCFATVRNELHPYRSDVMMTLRF